MELKRLNCVLCLLDSGWSFDGLIGWNVPSIRGDSQGLGVPTLTPELCEECLDKFGGTGEASPILDIDSLLLGVPPMQESVTIDIDNAVIGLACVCEKHGENTQSLLSGNVSFFLLRSMMSNSSI